MEFNWWIFIGITVLTAIVDMVWALYFTYISEKKALKAAGMSALIILISGFTVVQYLENHWYLGAAVLGAFIGTYIVVKRKRKDEHS